MRAPVYVDEFEARDQKTGSDHDRAEAWRVLALSERKQRCADGLSLSEQLHTETLRRFSAEAEVAQERYERAEALLRYVLLEDMEHGDRGREPLDGLIERLGALMDAEVQP